MQDLSLSRSRPPPYGPGGVGDAEHLHGQQHRGRSPRHDGVPRAVRAAFRSRAGRRAEGGYDVQATHIRGRPGLDVVVTPAELQAEVSGRPRKTTGKQTQVRTMSPHSLSLLNQ
jgi:hypothetical protein